MIAVIDAGIVMNTALLPILTGDITIPSSVLAEIKSQQAKHILEIMIAEKRLSVISPLPKYLQKIKTVVSNMGQNRLSMQDMDVLAVALMMTKQDEVILYSDDYGVRNVAHELRIQSSGVTTSGGNKKRKYKYQCTACGRMYHYLVDDCDICGHTKFKRYRR